jgi:CheY-like chemotaxis protein
MNRSGVSSGAGAEAEAHRVGGCGPVPAGVNGELRPRRRRPSGWLPVDQARSVLAGRSVVFVGADVETGGRIFVGLSRAGCHVRLVRRRVQLGSFIDERVPSLILIDFDDADNEPPRLIRELRADPRTARALIIAVTSGDPPPRRRLGALSCDAVLARPTDPGRVAQELLRVAPLLADW